NETPGPDRYFPKAEFGSGPKYSFRLKTNSYNDPTPGPQDYSAPPIPPSAGAAPSFTMRPKVFDPVFTDREDAHRPGMNEYYPKLQWSERATSLKGWYKESKGKMIKCERGRRVTPGPANYIMPNNLFSGPQHILTGRNVPIEEEDYYVPPPGPADYAPKFHPTRDQAPLYSLQSRRKLPEPDCVRFPGPGSYTPRDRQIRGNDKQKATLKGRRRTTMDSSPGPADYNVSASIAPAMSVSTLARMGVRKQVPERVRTIVEDTPGPADYDVKPLEKTKKSGPAYSLSKRLGGGEPGLGVTVLALGNVRLRASSDPRIAKDIVSAVIIVRIPIDHSKMTFPQAVARQSSQSLRCTRRSYAAVPAASLPAARGRSTLAKPVIPVFLTAPPFPVDQEPNVALIHSAVLADTLCRWEHFKGNPASLVMGVDSAEVSEKSLKLKALMRSANISATGLARTPEVLDAAAVQNTWRKLAEKKHIVKGSHNGAECYVFRIDRVRPQLITWLKNNDTALFPASQYTHVLEYLSSNKSLPDFPVSHASSQSPRGGIAVPGDSSHTISDSFATLASYVATKPDASHIHIAGGNAEEAFGLTWPAMLLSASGGTIPTTRIVTYGGWTHDGIRIADSANEDIHPARLIELHGADVLRHYLIRVSPKDRDVVFEPRNILSFYDAELYDCFTLPTYRLLTSDIFKDQVVPESTTGFVRDYDEDIVAKINKLPELVDAELVKGDVAAALQIIVEYLEAVNTYWRENEPIVEYKYGVAGNKKRGNRALTIAYHTYEGLRVAGLVMQAFIPWRAERLLEMLGVDPKERGWANARIGRLWTTPDISGLRVTKH
ncbi:hypothetical protein BDK51DRAFT_30328, partial [Blyttiomyces helicus]